MIASYGPLHWELAGEIMVWGIVVTVLWAGSAYFRSSLSQDSTRPKGEVIYIGLAYTLLLLNAIIAGLFLVGLVGFRLHVVTGLWFVWEMFYLLSIPIVFHVFPVLTVVAWVWSVVGRWRMRYQPRVPLLAMLLTLALTLSAASYFALEFGVPPPDAAVSP